MRRPINVFRTSLSIPLSHSSYKPHLERIFPHGGVVLMTEDFIRHDPDNALAIVIWFREHVRTKFPGTWKMFMRPNIQGWLLDMDSHSEHDK